MPFSLALVLAVGLAGLAIGCSTTPVQPRATVAQFQSQEADGLLLSVRPMTDAAELKQTFKANLLARGVLPIKVKVENRNATNSFIITRERVVVMNEASGEINSPGQGDIAKDLATVTRGQQWAVVARTGSWLILVVTLTHSDGELIDKVAESNLTDKEFYTRVLSVTNSLKKFAIDCKRPWGNSPPT